MVELATPVVFDAAAADSPRAAAPSLLRSVHPLVWLLLIGLLAGSTYMRVRSLTENGIRGSDTFQYWDIALMWNNGQLALNNDLKEYRQYFRPVFYALNTLSLHVFGMKDYALRGMIASFETLNVLLVFLLGHVLLRYRSWAALMLAAAYAATPSAFLLSQVELPHTYSVTFVLAMLLCYVQAHRHLRPDGHLSRGWVAATGFFLGMAATTHGSTMLLAPVMVALLAGEVFIRERGLGFEEQGNEIYRLCLYFGGAFAANYVLWGLPIGYVYMVKAIISEATIRSGDAPGRIGLVKTWLVDGPSQSISPLAMYLFYASIPIIGVLVLAKKRVLSLIHLAPAAIVVVWCAIFAAVFENVFLARLFLPFNALVLVTIFIAAAELSSLVHKKLAVLIVAGLAVALSYSGVTRQIGNLQAYFDGREKGAPRAAYDVIGGKVTDDAKLLVTPYIQYYHRPQFRAKVYFDDDAVYLMDCGAGALPDFVKANKIKYVMVSKDVDERIAQSPGDRYKNLGSCTGMSTNDYDLKNDLQRIHAYLASVHAVPLGINERYGELYALP